MRHGDTDLEESNGVLIERADQLAAAGCQAQRQGQRSQAAAAELARPSRVLQFALQLAHLTGRKTYKKTSFMSRSDEKI